MGIHYCDFLWGILMGKSYWEILWGYLMGLSYWDFKWTGLGWDGLGWAVLGWAGQECHGPFSSATIFFTVSTKP